MMSNFGYYEFIIKFTCYIYLFFKLYYVIQSKITENLWFNASLLQRREKQPCNFMFLRKRDNNNHNNDHLGIFVSLLFHLRHEVNSKPAGKEKKKAFLWAASLLVLY